MGPQLCAKTPPFPPFGGTNIGKGTADITYRFEFRTTYANPNTILQTYLGPVTPTEIQFPTNQAFGI